MLHVLSVRADLPAVVVIDVQSSSWDIRETEDLNFYAWRAAHVGFVRWCRRERYAGRLSDEFAASEGVVSLFRTASRSESFVHAFERCGANLVGIDVLDLSPALCASLPRHLLARTEFSLANLGRLPPPDLVFGPDYSPEMKVLLTASDSSDDYGLPIAWETSYEDLVGGKLPSNRGGYGKWTQGVVEIARPDGTFSSPVPDGMSVMYAPLVDEDEEVTLLETCVFESRESVLDRIRLAVERHAQVATLARIVYDRKLLGLSEALRPVSVTVVQDRDRSAFVVRVEFDEGELLTRDVRWRKDSVSTERAQLWASETAMRLARSMNIPFLI
jgi:hypothetical protein